MSKDLYGGFKFKRGIKKGEKKKFFCKDCGKWVEGLIISGEGFILSKRVLCPLCGRCYLVVDVN